MNEPSGISPNAMHAKYAHHHKSPMTTLTKDKTKERNKKAKCHNPTNSRHTCSETFPSN